MNKRLINVLAACVVAVACLASMIGCSGKEQKAAAPAAKQYRIAAISGYFSQGFGKLIVDGLEKSKADYGIEYKLIDTGTRSLDYEEQFNTVAKSGSYDLILVMGWELVDALLKTSTAFPNQRFMFIDGELENKNIIYMNFAEHEGSFLAGVLAARLSEKKGTGSIVGFVGGRDIPVIRNFLTGYQQGVAYANPKYQVRDLFAGTFDDPARGKELAISLYKSGADVVFNVAGPTGEGVLQAAKDTKKFAIGVDVDQSPAAPEYIPSSVLKNVDVGVYNIIGRLVKDGTLKPETITLGIKDNSVGLCKNDSYKQLVPQEIRDEIDAIEAKIKSGEITVKSFF